MKKFDFTNKKREFVAAGSLLNAHDFVERMTKNSKYLKEEFQDFGVRLSHQLNDPRHKSLYIKLAKELPRSVLERALTFTLDYPTQDHNKGKLYMWKLNELCSEKGLKIPSSRRKKSTTRKTKKTEQFSLLK